MSNTKFVCVHGNIGAGKSTWISNIKNQTSPSEQIMCLQEPIEKWGIYLQKYYDALHHLQNLSSRELQNPTQLSTLQAQHDIINFEVVITNIQLMQYKQITNERTSKQNSPKQNTYTQSSQLQHQKCCTYIFERSIEESWLIFCQELKQYLTSEQWNFLSFYFEVAIEQEITFDEEYYCSAPTNVLMERIKKRGRKEEQDMSYEYVNKLNFKYQAFYEKRKDKLKLI